MTELLECDRGTRRFCSLHHSGGSDIFHHNTTTDFYASTNVVGKPGQSRSRWRCRSSRSSSHCCTTVLTITPAEKTRGELAPYKDTCLCPLMEGQGPLEMPEVVPDEPLCPRFEDPAMPASQERKAWQAVSKALGPQRPNFPRQMYGSQTVLGKTKRAILLGNGLC